MTRQPKYTCLSKPLGMLVAAGLMLTGLFGVLPGTSGAVGESDRSSSFVPWWDFSWNYRMPLTLDTASNPKALTDYPVRLNLSLQDLISAGKLRSDWGDMRFTAADGTTALNHWVESEGNVWVKVAALPASSSTNIYLYYGNPAATSSSDGEKTFDFFDDFGSNNLDSDKWQVVNYGPYSFTNGELTIAADGSYQPGKLIAASAPSENNYIIRSRFKITGGFHIDERIGLGIKTDTSTGRGYNYVLRDFTDLDEKSFLDDYVVWNSRAGKWAKNTWYLEEIYHDGSSVKARLDDGAWQSQGWMGRTGYPSLYFGSYDGTSVWDWALVREYRPPEPTATLGMEELPFKLLSFELDPMNPNEGDRVAMNVTFNNPTTVPISFNISFRDGPEFEGSVLIDRRRASLNPKGDTVVGANWTAKGGQHTMWVALDESPVASQELAVNWYPVLDFIPDQLLMQDWYFRLQLTARDRDNEQLIWAEDSDLFKFNRTNNTGAEIAFQCTNDNVGYHPVNVSVTDPHGCSARQRFFISIENLNDRPALAAIPSLVATEEVEFRYRVNATDPDLKWGDALTFTDDTQLFGIDEREGNFIFTPTNEQVGRYAIEISVFDNQSAYATRSFTLTVKNVNDPPVINPIPPQSATEDRLWQAKVTASDPDQKNSEGDALRFSDDSPLFNISADSGLINFTPANKDVGVHECNITVKDRSGASSSTRLVLKVDNVNDPPVMSALPDQFATEDQPFELRVNASDEDMKLGLDNLTFSDDSPLFDIDPGTGKISFIPTNAQVGKHQVKIKVVDRYGASATATFALDISNVNDPPFNVAITSVVEGAKFREGESIWLNGSGEDIDAGDRLEFKWYDNGQLMDTGRSLKVTPKPGKHLVALEVTDGIAISRAEVNLEVTKKEEPVTTQVTSMIPIALLVLVLAAAAAAGVLVLGRRRRKEEAAPPADARIESVPEAAGGAAPGPPPPPRTRVKKVLAAPPPALSADEAQKRDEAKKAMASAEDRIAESLEGGSGGAEVTSAMESLDIARDFLKAGDYAEAMQYAREAEAALEPKGVEAPAERKEAPAVGRLSCPGCGEELDPDWGACPICGHQTR